MTPNLPPLPPIPSPPPLPPQPLRLSNFFKLDIFNINLQSWEFIHGYDDNGNIRQLFSLHISNQALYELGSFRTFILRTLNGKKSSLELYATDSTISPELVRFISFLVGQWGEDELGNKYIGEDDHIRASKGTFIRMWDGINIKNDTKIKGNPIVITIWYSYLKNIPI